MSALFDSGGVRLLAIGLVLVMLMTGAAWCFRASRVFSFVAASRIFQQPFVGLLLFFGFATVLFQSGATKMMRVGGLTDLPGNGAASTGIMLADALSAETLFGSNTNAVTNVCWRGIQVASNRVWMAVAWPSDGVLPESALDLYAVDDLAREEETNAWTWIGRVSISNYDSRVAIGVDRSALPGNASEASFFRLGLLADSDLDGLTDAYENFVSKTDPARADTDGDGMPDGFEVSYGLDPFSVDADDDADSDGLTNAEEFAHGTDPCNADTDGDGLPDAVEIGGPVEVLGQSPFAAGILVTNVTDAMASVGTGRVDCVEVRLPAPFELAGSTYGRLTLDPNGIVYLRTEEATNAVPSAVFPDDYAEVLSRANACVLMPYWSRLSCVTFGANASDVRVERTENACLVTYENMRFDPTGAMDMVPAQLRPLVPMLVSSAPVSFQVEINPSQGSVIYRYRLGSGSSPLADGVTTGRLAAIGAQGRFMGMATECGFGDEGAVTSGAGIRITVSSGTDPACGDADGDGMSDGAELAAGRDPNDATDAGKTNEASVFLAFGDPSLTRSECYRVEIDPIVESPVAHVPSAQSFTTQAGGLWRGRVSLEKGWRYAVRMVHVGTALDDGADYDYVLGFDALSPLIEISDPQGLRGCHVLVDKTTDYAADGKVAVITVYDVDALICAPENWSELAETRVVLDTEEFRVKFTIRPRMDSLDEVIRVFGNAFTATSSGTAPTGVSIPLSGAEILDADLGSEVRVAMAWTDLRDFGVLPSQDEDGVNEMAWLDMASRSDAKQNLEDSRAFSAIGYEDRGTASTYDPTRNLYSTPPNSYPSESYFKAAGCEIVTVAYGGAESQRGQVMNQADYFYFSGHGSHDSGVLSGAFTPEMAGGMWNRDLKCVVFSACSVLDINDYNNLFPGVSHSFSPGKRWASVGPTNLLGYCSTAPADKNGVTSAIIRNWLANRGAMGDVDAWMEANRAARAWNACAIVKGEKYLYFKKKWLWGIVVEKQKDDW